MRHIVTINRTSLKDSLKKPGCGECQASCQSACKNVVHCCKSGVTKIKFYIG
jgi:hypothetical protein